MTTRNKSKYVETDIKKKNVVFQAKLLLEAIFTYLTDTQVQKGQGVLGSLDPFILDLELICWCSMAILDLYIYFRYVSKNDDEKRLTLHSVVVSVKSTVKISSVFVAFL